MPELAILRQIVDISVDEEAHTFVRILDELTGQVEDVRAQIKDVLAGLT